MSRRGRALVLAVAVGAFALAGVLAPPAPTDAAWTDTEVGTSSALAAGSVAPVVTMSCIEPLGGPLFSWTAPTGGLPRSGYRWTVTGGLSGSGNLAASATSVQLNGGLLGIGTGTFSLYALEAGGWQSTPRTGTVTFVTALLYSCSVP